MEGAEKAKLREDALAEHEKALEAYTKALEIYRSTDDRVSEANVLVKMAEIYRAKARIIFPDIDDPPVEERVVEERTVKKKKPN